MFKASSSKKLSLIALKGPQLESYSSQSLFLVPFFCRVFSIFFYCHYLLDFILKEHTTLCCPMCLLIGIHVYTEAWIRSMFTSVIPLDSHDNMMGQAEQTWCAPVCRVVSNFLTGMQLISDRARARAWGLAVCLSAKQSCGRMDRCHPITMDSHLGLQCVPGCVFG